MLKIGNEGNITLSVVDGDYWKDESLFLEVERAGFTNLDWKLVPDEILLYLFLNDEPTIGTKRTESTKKEYFRDLNQFLTYINNHRLGSLHNLQPETLLQYQRFLNEKYKTTTLLRRTSVIKHFLRYLFHKGILQQDLTIQMKKTKAKKEDLVNRDLYDHEVKQLLGYFQKKDWFAYTLVYALVSTGMRINELTGALWSDLRYEPTVDHYFLTVTGKGDKQRDIIIFNDVLEVIMENRRRKNLSTAIGRVDGTAFFPKADGGSYNTTYLGNEFTRIVGLAPFEFIQSRFLREKESASSGKNIRYRITPHTCRHYTAAYYMDKGVDAKAIQDMLGHSSLMTTEKYLRRKRTVENHAGVKLGQKNFS